MQTLFTLDIKNYDSNLKHSKRDSARGIIVFTKDGRKPNLPFKPDDKIALIYARNCGYYKFPGGGIRSGEDKIKALIREVSEEAGLSVIPESVREFGVVPRLQKSSKNDGEIFNQESFYYFCDVSRQSHGQNLDAYEAEAGFELQTVTIAEAIEKNMQYATNNDFDLVMIMRDTNVLQLLTGMPAEPSRAFAEYLLKEGAKQNPGPWKEHSIAVARAAEKTAKAVITAGTNSIKPERAYIYGLLHDIGRRCGFTYMAHVIDGYEYLAAMGFENAARICLTHSFNRQTTEDYIGRADVSDEKLEKIKSLLASYQYDDYDRLIQLLDSTCGANGTQNLELRMGDVKKRYGHYPQKKWDKNFELKEYFEKLTGKNLYEVIKQAE